MKASWKARAEEFSAIADQHDAADTEDAQSKVAVKLADLLDEMQALVRILPVTGEPLREGRPGSLTEARLREGRAEVIATSEEDAVEDGFDNVPL